MSQPWDRLEDWLAEDPESLWAEVEIGEAARWRVRLMKLTGDEYPNDSECIADAESATLEGATDGALQLAREFREGGGR